MPLLLGATATFCRLWFFPLFPGWLSLLCQWSSGLLSVPQRRRVLVQVFRVLPFSASPLVTPSLVPPPSTTHSCQLAPTLEHQHSSPLLFCPARMPALPICLLCICTTCRYGPTYHPPKPPCPMRDTRRSTDPMNLSNPFGLCSAYPRPIKTPNSLPGAQTSPCQL